MELTTIALILLGLALALGAGWWLGRRRGSTIESERDIALDRAMEQLDRRFDDLAGRQLRENIENFLRLAKENLGGHQQLAQTTLKERELAIESMIKPIQESLTRTSEALREIEVERQRDFGSLRQHLTDMRESHTTLQKETRNLVQALSKPQVRGQWGEIALRRLVELAGMTAHVDFEEQVHVAGEDGALRPDMVIRHARRPGRGGGRQDTPRRLPDGSRGGERRVEDCVAAAPCAARGGTRTPALLEEIRGAVRTCAAVRRPVPAGRPVPVGRARPAARPARSRNEQRRDPDDALHAAGAPESGAKRLEKREARRGRGTDSQAGRRARTPGSEPSAITSKHSATRSTRASAHSTGRSDRCRRACSRAHGSSPSSACAATSRSRT